MASFSVQKTTLLEIPGGNGSLLFDFHMPVSALPSIAGGRAILSLRKAHCPPPIFDNAGTYTFDRKSENISTQPKGKV